MRTITIELNQDQNAIAELLEQQPIERGDKLEVLADQSLRDGLILIGMVALFIVLWQIFRKNVAAQGLHQSDEAGMPGVSTGEIFSKYKTPEEAEAGIEATFGVEVELKKGNSQGDPIDSLFGVWADKHDFDFEKHRTTQWEREN